MTKAKNITEKLMRRHFRACLKTEKYSKIVEKLLRVNLLFVIIRVTFHEKNLKSYLPIWRRIGLLLLHNLKSLKSTSITKKNLMSNYKKNVSVKKFSEKS